MNRSLKEAERRAKNLQAKLVRAVENPSAHDPVYQACQRIFHKEDDLVLTRGQKIRSTIRRKALTRFFHGCPPRKRTDTSFGDSFNWEWIIFCAGLRNAEVIIVSRDNDYGITIGNKAYINDHLKQEFSERVSSKRKLILQNRLSEALKHFEVPVSKRVEEAEKEVVQESAARLTEDAAARIRAKANYLLNLPSSDYSSTLVSPDLGGYPSLGGASLDLSEFSAAKIYREYMKTSLAEQVRELQKDNPLTSLAEQVRELLKDGPLTSLAEQVRELLKDGPLTSLAEQVRELQKASPVRPVDDQESSNDQPSSSGSIASLREPSDE
jgi:hypothetical protein